MRVKSHIEKFKITESEYDIEVVDILELDPRRFRWMQMWLKDATEVYYLIEDFTEHMIRIKDYCKKGNTNKLKIAKDINFS